jgi:hypothetical protein
VSDDVRCCNCCAPTFIKKVRLLSKKKLPVPDYIMTIISMAVIIVLVLLLLTSVDTDIYTLIGTCICPALLARKLKPYGSNKDPSFFLCSIFFFLLLNGWLKEYANYSLTILHLLLPK